MIRMICALALVQSKQTIKIVSYIIENWLYITEV